MTMVSREHFVEKVSYFELLISEFGCFGYSKSEIGAKDRGEGVGNKERKTHIG